MEYMLHNFNLITFVCNLFIGSKIAADCFKDEIALYLKANDRLKFA